MPGNSREPVSKILRAWFNTWACRDVFTGDQSDDICRYAGWRQHSGGVQTIHDNSWPEEFCADPAWSCSTEATLVIQRTRTQGKNAIICVAQIFCLTWNWVNQWIFSLSEACIDSNFGLHPCTSPRRRRYLPRVTSVCSRPLTKKTNTGSRFRKRLGKDWKITKQIKTETI